MSTITLRIYVPQVSFDYAAILDRAKLAEEVGFDSLWFFDHLYSPAQPDRPSYRVDTGHLHPGADHPAAGRPPRAVQQLPAPVAAGQDGHHARRALGGPSRPRHRQWIGRPSTHGGLPWGTFPERSERLGESLEILTRMFTGQPTTFSGRHYEVDDLPNLPPPGPEPAPTHPHRGHRSAPHDAARGPLRRRLERPHLRTRPLGGEREGARRSMHGHRQGSGDDQTIPGGDAGAGPRRVVAGAGGANAQRRFGAEGWGLDAGG